MRQYHAWLREFEILHSSRRDVQARIETAERQSIQALAELEYFPCPTMQEQRRAGPASGERGQIAPGPNRMHEPLDSRDGREGRNNPALGDPGVTRLRLDRHKRAHRDTQSRYEVRACLHCRGSRPLLLG